MIIYSFKSSFERSVKKLSSEERSKIKSLAIELIDLLSEKKKLSKGIGLTQLRKNYWEIRSSIRRRILFRYERNKIDFVLAGSHEQVKKFLKNL